MMNAIKRTIKGMGNVRAVEVFSICVENTEQALREISRLSAVSRALGIPLPVRDRLKSLFSLCVNDLQLGSETLARDLAWEYPDDARQAEDILRARLAQMKFVLKSLGGDVKA